MIDDGNDDSDGGDEDDEKGVDDKDASVCHSAGDEQLCPL